MSERTTQLPRSQRTTSSQRHSVRYVTDVGALENLPDVEREELRAVSGRYAFRVTESYLGLIDWSNEDDPIRRLVIPSKGELDEFGRLDVSEESANRKVHGLQHKYADTALLLVTDQCAGFCRYCFRKRLFLPGAREVNRHVDAGVDYIRKHHEITDVLVTGGDPLTLPTPRLGEIIDSVMAIPHVHTVRIGTKMPAYNPRRILGDRALLEVLRSHSSDAGRVYVVCHFDHPRELTRDAVEAIRLMRESGAVCVNQCPVTRGVNDDACVLAELFQACTDAGCPQYYIFQCRPTTGNSPFTVPLVRGFGLVAEARSRLSGLSRRARYCISHATGKVEVVGLDDERIYARYHRAKDPADEGRMLVLRRDDDAYWLDQLEPA